MRKLVAFALGSLLLAGGLWAAPIELPAEVKVKPGRLLRIEAKGDSKTIKWINVHEDLDAIPSETGRWLIVTGPTPGRYKLAAYGSAADGGPSDPVYVTVIVDGPPPPPPVPPAPPVPPTPPPSPAPIPVAGFRVLIVEEAMERAKLPAAQAAIIFDARVREYLNTKCVVGPDGKTREWNIFDQHVYTGDAAKHWQDAMKLKRDSLPWIIISDGKTGYEGPLPPTVEDTLHLLKKYGG